jgi:hypothetical protein
MLVLDEAMDKKLVRIKEGDQESVNQLTMVNSAEQPVFVLAGEVIIGGKQDRIIGQNTIIPARTTLAVPVFCVERGRWNNASKVFTSAKALAHGRLRGKASHEAQGEVWAEVNDKNMKRKTTSSTDTYRKVAAQQSDGTLAAFEKEIRAGLAKLAAEDRARMVGYAVAVNGKVATVDVFDSPALFRKLEGKLVKSYVTEAIDVAAAKDVKPPTSAEIYKFTDEIEKVSEQDAYDNPEAKTRAKRGPRASKSSVFRAAKPGAAKAPEKATYENYQAK